jgi:hypothetical protein
VTYYVLSQYRGDLCHEAAHIHPGAAPELMASQHMYIVHASWGRSTLYCKKRLAVFPSPAEMPLTKLSLAGNYLIIPRQGEFGLWHPSWGRENDDLFLPVDDHRGWRVRQMRSRIGLLSILLSFCQGGMPIPASYTVVRNLAINPPRFYMIKVEYYHLVSVVLTVIQRRVNIFLSLHNCVFLLTLLHSFLNIGTVVAALIYRQCRCKHTGVIFSGDANECLVFNAVDLFV